MNSLGTFNTLKKCFVNHKNKGRASYILLLKNVLSRIPAHATALKTAAIKKVFRYLKKLLKDSTTSKGWCLGLGN